MYIEPVALNHLVCHRVCLLCTEGIQFDSVPNGVFVGSDLGEAAAIPETGAQHGESDPGNARQHRIRSASLEGKGLSELEYRVWAHLTCCIC